MRISDWSSDVCSSDLQTAVDRRLDIFGIHRLRPRNCARQSGLREGTGAAADQRTETVSRTHRAHSSNLATWPAPPPPRPRHQPVADDRKRDVEGTSVAVRVEHGGRGIITKKTKS